MKKIFGLLGRSLGHSFSVPIHKFFGNEDYRLIELDPDELQSFLSRDDIGGLNVTIPYKQIVMPLCDYIDESARAIGAVNTIVSKNGKLCAYNTDIFGLTYAVNRAGMEISGKKVVILGSGGTSKTAQAMSRKLNAREIIVISRTGENNYANLSRHSDADIIINTTPVGMYPHCPDSPVDLDLFPNLSGVMDVVYNPIKTGLIIAAEKRGIPHSGGLSMLVAQAKASEELFFDISIDDDLIEQETNSLCRDATNIAIIGMPGSGKSSISIALSKLSGRELIDLDEYITKAVGSSPAEIITSRGEARFRNIEYNILDTISKQGGRIISTGGGIVVNEENYALLHENSRVYCLSRPLELLATEGRPLSSNITALYNKRRPLYEHFMDTETENTGTIEDAATIIWSDFCENTRY